jgi:hypothetical protein
MKNLIKILTIFLISVNSFSQINDDFIIIDEVTENFELIEDQLSAQSNVYITNGDNLNPFMQISNQIKNLKIVNLHIYVTSMPGILFFNNTNINIRNIDTYANELTSWNNSISGEVIFHSKNLFNGLDGILLKHRLETITGLIFTTK